MPFRKLLTGILIIRLLLNRPLARSWLPQLLAKVKLIRIVLRTEKETYFFYFVLFIKIDFIQEIYLNELRAYKPSKSASTEKTDLVDKFVLPTPPPAPVLETAPTAEVDDAAAMKEEAWPAPYNPIVRT